MKLFLVLAALLAIFQNALGFTSMPLKQQTSVQTTVNVAPSTTTQLSLFGFGQKDDGSPGDYLCPDCGYVFTKGPKAWAALPEGYACPPCGAPKFRFKKVPKGSESGKVAVKKSWF
mmetsp:Transcript_8432/g.11086  ORF Transcript_8432/g.11086 Transcript_8432/m.11086 type:complete len:116 (-) Transcript_8432:326-673(-)|eukprot:CAMPEP_0198142890 /NCGR_PEP_ID=MMETSP1443-20131203/5569_1 /TAXON_ID=186043 /ORGANISM="Entomoneis sp., Strain CCMP2396" /LENGTH=115 /DNA_ID=CAMNT_0043806009 /DNA_START=175 /DNA_END=522 /DNA_ORIENTATION=+